MRTTLRASAVAALVLTLWTAAPVSGGETTRIKGMGPRLSDCRANDSSSLGAISYIGIHGSPCVAAGLWVSDGSGEGTVHVAGGTATGPNWPWSGFVPMGDLVLFAAAADETGVELWRTKGTTGSTELVKDLWPGSDPPGPRGGGPHSSSPRAFTRLGHELFFLATVDRTGGLWRTDGTSAGTEQVRAIRGAAGLTRFRGSLFLAGAAPGSGLDGGLWKSDGTSAGTVLVKRFGCASKRRSCRHAYPRELTRLGDLLLFVAYDEPGGWGLWRSDGTRRGTRLVARIGDGTGPRAAAPRHLARAGAVVYFAADDGRRGEELWKTDGSRAGTMRVKDIRPGPGSSKPHELAHLGGILYFAATDGRTSVELWRSDGTAAGTRRVKDIAPGQGRSQPRHLTRLGRALYFDADDGTTGRELWRTMGTGSTTKRVHDIRPGPASSYPRALRAVGGSLLFLAGDEGFAVGLWRHIP